MSDARETVTVGMSGTGSSGRARPSVTPTAVVEAIGPEVRTVKPKPRRILKDTDVDDFQNICVNQHLTIYSREGGRLYCVKRGAVRWFFQVR